jgi:hypothetical protein
VTPVVLALVLLLLGAGGAVAYLLLRDDASTATGLGPDGHAPLYTASHKCGIVGDLEDGDRTLILDTAGSKDSSGDPISSVMCALEYVKAPASVRSQIEHTRAVDGRQTGTWPGFEASWVFHPDTGLDLIVRQIG